MRQKSTSGPMRLPRILRSIRGMESIWNFVVIFGQVAAVMMGVFVATAAIMLVVVAASRRARRRAAN